MRMVDFRDEFQRLCSFPRAWGAEKSVLALQGFYFSGVGRQIVCAFCQVLLLNVSKVAKFSNSGAGGFRPSASRGGQRAAPWSTMQKGKFARKLCTRNCRRLQVSQKSANINRTLLSSRMFVGLKRSVCAHSWWTNGCTLWTQTDWPRPGFTQRDIMTWCAASFAASSSKTGN